MTVEQVLIYLLAAIAAIFLFLGLAQALDNRPARPRRRRGRMPEAPEGHSLPAGRSTVERGGAPAWARHGKAEPPPGFLAPGTILPEASQTTVAIVATTLAVEPGPPTVEAEADPRAVVAETPAMDPGPCAVTAEAPAGDSGSPAVATSAAAVDAEAQAVAQAPPSPAAVVAIDGGPVEHEAVASATTAAAALPAPRSASDPDLVMVEDAMGLCLGGKHEESLARLTPRLAADREVGAEAQRSHVVAALHSLAGLAQHALGDAAAARGSFEAGVRVLPEPGSEPCPPRIAALSVPVARRLLEGIAGPSNQGEDRRAGEVVDGARLAAFWLNWRLHAAPGDQGALALLDTAREVMAESLNEAVVASIGRHEYRAAHNIVQDAVDAGELPSARGDVLLELLGVTFRQEIDRLTAAAMRGGKDESRAVSGLGEAEALLATLPEGAISRTQRVAVVQRIWRGHSKLGFRRLHLGQLDAAADTLFHALAMREIGRRRQRQVRDALVRALEGLGDQGAAAVSALLAEGKQPEAAEGIARLGLRIQRAREQGVSDEELAVASAKLEQLRRRLDEPTTAG